MRKLISKSADAVRLNRRDFIRGSATIVGASGLMAAGIGCSSSPTADAGAAADGAANADGSVTPDSGTPTANCKTNGTKPTIADNHGHALTVSKEDVAAAVEKVYDIKGTAPHAHSVTVTAANFATLATNTSITLTSTSAEAHTHSITVACA